MKGSDTRYVWRKKDEPGLGDETPCAKCGSALDTGLECTECGHDMRPEIYPTAPRPKLEGDWTDARDILLALKRLSHGYDACIQGKGLVERAIAEIEGLRAAFAVWEAIPALPPPAKDAARYRWLKKQAAHIGFDANSFLISDDRIDAAIANENRPADANRSEST